MRKTVIAVVAVIFVFAACGGGGTPAASHQSSSATTTPHFEGDSASSWCDYANQVDDTSRLNGEFQNDPEAWVARVTALMGKAATSAPAPIKADVGIMVGAVRGLAQGLAANHYDLSKLSPEQLAGLQDPSFVQAGLRVRAYDQQVCHTPN